MIIRNHLTWMEKLDQAKLKKTHKSKKKENRLWSMNLNFKESLRMMKMFVQTLSVKKKNKTRVAITIANLWKKDVLNISNFSNFIMIELKLNIQIGLLNKLQKLYLYNGRRRKFVIKCQQKASQEMNQLEDQTNL